MGGCLGKDDKKDDKKDVVKEASMPEYKIIVVGDSSVGKTAIIH